MNSLEIKIADRKLKNIDSLCKFFDLSRSEFIQAALHRQMLHLMEEQHRIGYERIPQDENELISESVWVDDEDWSEWYKDE